MRNVAEHKMRHPQPAAENFDMSVPSDVDLHTQLHKHTDLPTVPPKPRANRSQNPRFRSSTPSLSSAFTTASGLRLKHFDKRGVFFATATAWSPPPLMMAVSTPLAAKASATWLPPSPIRPPSASSRRIPVWVVGRSPPCASPNARSRLSRMFLLLRRKFPGVLRRRRTGGGWTKYVSASDLVGGRSITPDLTPRHQAASRRIVQRVHRQHGRGEKNKGHLEPAFVTNGRHGCARDHRTSSPYCRIVLETRKIQQGREHRTGRIPSKSKIQEEHG